MAHQATAVVNSPSLDAKKMLDEASKALRAGNANLAADTLSKFWNHYAANERQYVKSSEMASTLRNAELLTKIVTGDNRVDAQKRTDLIKLDSYIARVTPKEADNRLAPAVRLDSAARADIVRFDAALGVVQDEITARQNAISGFEKLQKQLNEPQYFGHYKEQSEALGRMIKNNTEQVALLAKEHKRLLELSSELEPHVKRAEAARKNGDMSGDLEAAKRVKELIAGTSGDLTIKITEPKLARLRQQEAADEQIVKNGLRAETWVHDFLKNRLCALDLRGNITTGDVLKAGGMSLALAMGGTAGARLYLTALAGGAVAMGAGELARQKLTGQPLNVEEINRMSNLGMDIVSVLLVTRGLANLASKSGVSGAATLERLISGQAGGGTQSLVTSTGHLIPVAVPATAEAAIPASVGVAAAIPTIMRMDANDPSQGRGLDPDDNGGARADDRGRGEKRGGGGKSRAELDLERKKFALEALKIGGMAVTGGWVAWRYLGADIPKMRQEAATSQAEQELKIAEGQAKIVGMGFLPRIVERLDQDGNRKHRVVEIATNDKGQPISIVEGVPELDNNGNPTGFMESVRVKPDYLGIANAELLKSINAQNLELQKNKTERTSQAINKANEALTKLKQQQEGPGAALSSGIQPYAETAQQALTEGREIGRMRQQAAELRSAGRIGEAAELEKKADARQKELARKAGTLIEAVKTLGGAIVSEGGKALEGVTLPGAQQTPSPQQPEQSKPLPPPWRKQ